MIEISNAELSVMQVVWQRQPLSANDVIAGLGDDNDWHEKTVKTLLNRLVSKGALGFNKDGRAYLYYPLITEQDYQLQQSRSFVDRLFAGKVAPLVAGFASQNKLKPDDVQQLKQLIADWEQEQNHD
ncbi:BlaI/MecI/CopY family transcriptional regulator [Rheinheimera baltica]|uniref:BlaI/MecI/CopY family transcriptional regulator n=2 Tax=Rheinheimera baltica TaxID=67576 RepID=A0ABT9HZN8_9GAMM|nr:BlaI/MecI/CopY family transcriptional regulator [Rheinheimera baltica]MDP5136592.1 BlaI/MecI/CopY family transcriptional regulator [Rheinheimera baltica]MDP5190952.1 BlaI/MecI/CopY family transcriptional regulator [Rheinheimera baltica]